MTDGDDAVVGAERSVMAGLFGDVGRRDPHAILRDAAIPGTSYAFVRDVLHDRRFVAPTVPESADLIIQLLARFMPRLPPDRHAVVRQRFSGLFSARRVGGYREVVQARSSALIDEMAECGTGDLVELFAALVFPVSGKAKRYFVRDRLWLPTTDSDDVVLGQGLPRIQLALILKHLHCGDGTGASGLSTTPPSHSCPTSSTGLDTS